MIVWSPARLLMSSRVCMILFRIESRRGLVENEDVGIMDQGLSETDSLTVTLGKLVDELLPNVRDLTPLDDRFDAPVYSRATESFDAGHELQVIEDRHLGIKRRCFRQIADPALDVERRLEDVETRYRRRAFCGWYEACEDSHGGGFACSVWSQESQDLPLANLEAHVVDGLNPSKRLRNAFDFNQVETPLLCECLLV